MEAHLTGPWRKPCNTAADQKGGIHDDVIAYRFDDHWMLVVNASNREKILSHLDSQVGDLKVNIQDRTMETAMVAIAMPAMLVKNEALISKTASLPFTGGLLPNWNVTDGEKKGARAVASRVSMAW